MTQKCKAIKHFSSSYRDNNYTFRCQLEHGHDGVHMETSPEWKVLWYGDDCGKCRCSQLSETVKPCKLNDGDTDCQRMYCTECAYGTKFCLFHQ
jgi:hypothetical protein